MGPLLLDYTHSFSLHLTALWNGGWVGGWVGECILAYVCFLQVEEEQMTLVLQRLQHAPVPLLSMASPHLKGAWTCRNPDFQLPITSVLRAFFQCFRESCQIQREKRDQFFFVQTVNFFWFHFIFACRCCKTEFRNDFLVLKIVNTFMHFY